jgi:hypothetical protein
MTGLGNQLIAITIHPSWNRVHGAACKWERKVGKVSYNGNI